MTGTRVAAAAAAIITMLLLQATVVAPLAYPASVSLPALVVAVVALRGGPATGMTFGFAAGLVADLASDHPAGLLALTWTGLGVVAGVAGQAGAVGWRRAVTVVALSATAAGIVAGVLFSAFGEAGAAETAVRWSPVGLIVHLLLALPVLPLVTAFLRSRALRPRRVTPTASAALARARAAGTGTASDEVAAVHRG